MRWTSLSESGTKKTRFQLTVLRDSNIGNLHKKARFSLFQQNTGLRSHTDFWFMQHTNANNQHFLARQARVRCVSMNSQQLTLGGIDLIGLSSVNRILNVRSRGIILLILIINLIIIG